MNRPVGKRVKWLARLFQRLNLAQRVVAGKKWPRVRSKAIFGIFFETPVYRIGTRLKTNDNAAVEHQRAVLWVYDGAAAGGYDDAFVTCGALLKRPLFKLS